MIIFTNPELMQAMQNSYVLRQKFNTHQIDILIEKAFMLTPKEQKKLLSVFKKEHEEVKNNTTKIKEKIRLVVKEQKKQFEKIIDTPNHRILNTIDNILKNV